MKAIVLNYEYGTVEIISHIPEDIEDDEDFVCNKLGYKNSEISWMFVEDEFDILHYMWDDSKKEMIYID